MRSSFGHNIKYTIFGESHSKAIGITIDGLPNGITIDFEKVDQELALRQGKAIFNTARQEKVEYEIVSGFFNNKTTGSAFTTLFYNKDTKSKDYSNLVEQPRPGHADYVAKVKYSSNQDYRGGGNFSGRLTTLYVYAGAIIKQILEVTHPDLKIITHLKEFQNINDINYYEIRKSISNNILSEYDIKTSADFSKIDTSIQKEIAIKIQNELQAKISELNSLMFNSNLEKKVIESASNLKNNLDSAGGALETIITNLPIGLGEPPFTSIESVLSSLIYTIPSIKSVAFGDSLSFKKDVGTRVKDEFLYLDEKQVYTLYNYNGGINGGISNGEDIVVESIIKPIPSLGKEQYSYSITKNKVQPLQINGRHDSTIINRVIPVINSIIYLGLYDLILENKKYEK